MRLIRFKTAMAVSCALAAAANISLGGVALPFVESFDNASWTNNWTKGDSEGVLRQTNGTNAKVEGTHAGYTDLADPRLAIDVAAANSNIWCRIATKPTLYADENGASAPADSQLAGASVAFYVSTSGTVRCYSNSAWKAVGSVDKTKLWYTFVVHSDYKNKLWDLYVSEGTNYLQSCRRLNTGALQFKGGSGFPDDKTLTNIVIKGIATIDAMAIARDRTPIADSGNLNRSNVLVTVATLNSNVATQVGLPATAYASNEDTLYADPAQDYLIGDDLAHWLQNDDVLTIRKDVGTSIDHTYKVSNGAWINLVANGLDRTDADIIPGQGVWITRTTSAGLLVCFADYDTARSASRTVYGTGSTVEPNLLGWNSLSWPQNTASQPANVGHFGFRNLAVAGDAIYLRVNGKMKRLSRSNDGKWMDGPNVSTDVLLPGQALWFFHSGDDILSWTGNNN